MGHLDNDAPDLVARLRSASAAQQRAYATAGARAALARHALDDPRLSAALAALDAGRLGATPERAAVQRARAAGAVAAALDDDPASAAYEANAALEDVPALRAALDEA